mmetsp:Transcript_2661/g.6736  ORF Transcript_2661/g.6736 Transcript_2661/m.6736 type:complete len:220 (-) Transcript_2661:174-833(-)
MELVLRHEPDVESERVAVEPALYGARSARGALDDWGAWAGIRLAKLVDLPHCPRLWHLLLVQPHLERHGVTDIQFGHVDVSEQEDIAPVDFSCLGAIDEAKALLRLEPFDDTREAPVLVVLGGRLCLLYRIGLLRLGSVLRLLELRIGVELLRDARHVRGEGLLRLLRLLADRGSNGIQRWWRDRFPPINLPSRRHRVPVPLALQTWWCTVTASTRGRH